MRKEQYTSTIATRNKKTDFSIKKPSWTALFVSWFHNFLESAE